MTRMGPTWLSGTVWTRNPGVLGSSRNRSSGFFSWECPWARHFKAQPGETQESMNNVSCRRDMTEIQLKAAQNAIQSINLT